MTPALTLMTLVCVVGISLGQLLFKKAALLIPAHAGWRDWAFNGWLITALALYGATTLLWIWVLRTAPLHLAYPFMGLAFVLVPVMGWMLLREPLHLQTLLGGTLILAGITLAARAQ